MNEALSSPQLAELFRQLRNGRHICLEDGELYEALTEHAEDFTALFGALGFELVGHRKGIYYFAGDSALSERARRFAVFAFLLVEHLGDAGRGIEDGVFGQEHAIDELPHFASERAAQTMASVGVQGPAELENVLRAMEKLGFADVPVPGRVRFRRPFYRLLDLCVRALTEGDGSGEASL